MRKQVEEEEEFGFSDDETEVKKACCSEMLMLIRLLSEVYGLTVRGISSSRMLCGRRGSWPRALKGELTQRMARPRSI